MNVFISGITGSLGTELARQHHEVGDTVYGCARNEKVVVNCRDKYPWGSGIACCDARNLKSFWFDDIDRVYHCAAMKHIEHAERYPHEAVVQNIIALENIIKVAHRWDAELRFISSDKACLPNSVYGATKLLGERMTLAAKGKAVRLGNLIGSSGSVFQKWKAVADSGGTVELTDPEMTRFFVSIRSAARFVSATTRIGKVSIPVMQAVRMGDLMELYPDHKIVGPRPGERTHEWLAAPGERRGYPDGFRSDFPTVERWTLADFARELDKVGCLPESAAKYMMCG